MSVDCTTKKLFKCVACENGLERTIKCFRKKIQLKILWWVDTVLSFATMTSREVLVGVSRLVLWNHDLKLRILSWINPAPCFEKIRPWKVTVTDSYFIFREVICFVSPTNSCNLHVIFHSKQLEMFAVIPPIEICYTPVTVPRGFETLFFFLNVLLLATFEMCVYTSALGCYTAENTTEVHVTSFSKKKSRVWWMKWSLARL